MSADYAGFIAFGPIIIVALCLCMCLIYQATQRRKRIAAQQQQQSSIEDPNRQPFQPNEFDYYFGQNDNINTGPRFNSTADVYYGDTNEALRTQPVVPAVVMSADRNYLSGQYPLAQPAAGTVPYGETAVEIHGSASAGGYGEAQYLPRPPTDS